MKVVIVGGVAGGAYAKLFRKFSTNIVSTSAFTGK